MTTAMARSKRPGLARSLFDALIAARPEGIAVEEKAAWTKLQGPSGQRIYVARTEIVRQVDLSGFGRGFVGTLPLKAPNGQVQAHLDLSHPQALEHFAMLLETLARLPKPEAAERAKRALPAAKTPEERDAEEAAKARADRLAAIMEARKRTQAARSRAEARPCFDDLPDSDEAGDEAPAPRQGDAF